MELSSAQGAIYSPALGAAPIAQPLANTDLDTSSDVENKAPVASQVIEPVDKLDIEILELPPIEPLPSKSLHLEVDQQAHHVTLQIIDDETGEVIKAIPANEQLSLHSKLSPDRALALLGVS